MASGHIVHMHWLNVSPLCRPSSENSSAASLMAPVPCLQSSEQLEAAFKVLSSYGSEPVDWQKLEEAAGVGVVVSII